MQEIQFGINLASYTQDRLRENMPLTIKIIHEEKLQSPIPKKKKANFFGRRKVLCLEPFLSIIKQRYHVQG